MNATDIQTLCNNWCAASVISGGDFGRADTERFRLLANGIQFHELSHEALCEAAIGLSQVLLRPNLNTIVDQDHFGLWSWCGELIFGSRPQLFPNEQYAIKSLYEVSIHAALALCREPVATREQWREQRRIDNLIPHHAQQLLMQSSLALAYLGFPVLEAVLKRACADYVAFDGQVKKLFSVPPRKKNGVSRRYDPNGLFKDRQCSSLRDLLFLHRDIVATPKQRMLIDRFRLHLTSLDQNRDPFDLLYRWRNDSLHGNTSFTTIGGTVLNLALLISIFELEKDFDQRRLRAIEKCRWESQLVSKSPWSFYPPY